MSDEDEAAGGDEGGGLPGWVMTFADLMSLLMCFFVLLLSFSELDLQKFKRLAGSMEKAFGVQREIKANEIPKGTSIIAQEFSPGKPQPTPFNEVRQKTIEELHQTLEFDQIKADTAEEQAKAVAEALAEEISQSKVEVEAIQGIIIIRILDKGSFSSASDKLMDSYIPVLEKIRGVLKEVSGDITIGGHTDDLPIYTARFRSNWDLSAARAVSVAHELMKDLSDKEPGINPRRIIVMGFADTQPRALNDSPANRKKNRRVEIKIEQGRKRPPLPKPPREELVVTDKIIDFPQVPESKIWNQLTDLHNLGQQIETTTENVDKVLLPIDE